MVNFKDTTAIKMVLAHNYYDLSIPDNEQLCRDVIEMMELRGLCEHCHDDKRRDIAKGIAADISSETLRHPDYDIELITRMMLDKYALYEQRVLPQE